MTLLWKSQNDFHSSLEISQRTRDSHIPTADHLCFRREERRMNRPQAVYFPSGVWSTFRAARADVVIDVGKRNRCRVQACQGPRAFFVAVAQKRDLPDEIDLETWRSHSAVCRPRWCERNGSGDRCTISDVKTGGSNRAPATACKRLVFSGLESGICGGLQPSIPTALYVVAA
jgi:hypothetical protein